MSLFALGCGVLAQALFTFLAAVYLTVDTECGRWWCFWRGRWRPARAPAA